MNRLLTVAILAICTVPLYAQSQPPNAAELAQTVFGIIAGDKTKTQTYCQVLDLSDELDQLDQQEDRKKAEDLSQKINELQTKLGTEYLALLEATKYLDPNSKGGQEIVSIFDKLDSYCGQCSLALRVRHLADGLKSLHAILNLFACYSFFNHGTG
jgi:hypothetical protein